jgi:hypothetical protein
VVFLAGGGVAELSYQHKPDAPSGPRCSAGSATSTHDRLSDPGKLPPSGGKTAGGFAEKHLWPRLRSLEKCRSGFYDSAHHDMSELGKALKRQSSYNKPPPVWDRLLIDGGFGWLAPKGFAVDASLIVADASQPCHGAGAASS